MNIHRLDGRCVVIGCKKNNANESCNSCASLAGIISLQLLVVAAIILSFVVCFIACFILLVIAAKWRQGLRRRL